MEPTHEQRELFERIFAAPTDENFNRLDAQIFPYFIAFLFEKDGRYASTVTEAHGGRGDGNVDIELRSIVGLPPVLLDVVQCKFHSINIGPGPIREFSTTVRHLGLNHGYFFTKRGFNGGAFDVARREPHITLQSLADVRTWIQQMHRRDDERREFPHRLGNMPIPVICLANNKGGVGKTTLTVNLAAGFVRQGYRVLVIDADPQCHASYWLLGGENNFPQSALTLQGVIEHQYPIHSLMRTNTTLDKVYLLPCHTDLANRIDLMNPAMERHLAEALAQLPLSDPPIDLILIDTQPALSPLTRAAIIASNGVIIPLRTDELSRLGIKPIIKFIETAEDLHRVNVHILGGFATHMDSRSIDHRQYLQLIAGTGLEAQRLAREQFNEDTFWIAQVHQYLDFQAAAAHHTSVAALHPRSAATREIDNAVGRIKERVNNYIPFRV